MTRYARLVRVLAMMALLIVVVGAGTAVAGMSDDEAAMVVAIAGGIGGCIGCVINIALAWWMAKDAGAKGQSPALWGALGFFLGWVGLVI
ncbi:MAG TPA: hypothetical protein QGH10_19185 [Armatimonadota bacterium]|nr:hypothetical protein [Armatimonadota bacterium]